MDKRRSLGEFPSSSRVLGGDLVRLYRDTMGRTIGLGGLLDTRNVYPPLFTIVVIGVDGGEA